MRSAFIGFCSSLVADTVTNSIKVIKTIQQDPSISSTMPASGNVREIFNAICKESKSGCLDLFTRGLGTRIMSNGFQSIVFTVLWKVFQDSMAQETATAQIAGTSVDPSVPALYPPASLSPPVPQ